MTQALRDTITVWPISSPVGGLPAETAVPPDVTAVARPCVVLVDDDDPFRESLGLNLVDEGFEVIDFSNGQSALDHFAAGNTSDIILLDWKMPGMPGIEVLRRLRRAGVRVPVVFLTALSDQVYEEAALGGGALDFVDKSRSLSIVVKRLRLIGEGGKTTASGRPGEEVLHRGRLQLKLKLSRAYWRNRQVELTLTEFNIVRLLATRSGEDITYREIYDLVHGHGFIAGYGVDGYRANVRSCIKRIRQKFREVDPEFGEIENYPGFGYRWRDDGSAA